MAKTIVSGGLPATNLRGYAHNDSFSPIGPEVPIFGTRGLAHEKARVGSRIVGESVRVFLDRSSRLEVDVQVSAGEARFHFNDPSVVSIHEWSASTGSLSIGNPTGELRVRAASSAEVLIE
ncbi:MAG: hypothetical protein KDB07_00175 [Planctomycetes bacterium]|nr:hypothetical protein [Planctomycetota bacterium]